ncbi:MAG: hypothetical protein P8P53_14430 [Tateyamaria sp.]|nr:hypothetical protein [Tateyamaria sp.]
MLLQPQVVKNQERFTQTEYKSLIIKSIICGAFVLFASNPAMADEVLTGNNLVQSLSGKSLSCVADGSPMSLTFSVANKKGHVSYSGQWKGKNSIHSIDLPKRAHAPTGGKRAPFLELATVKLYWLEVASQKLFATSTKYRQVKYG